jgi:hypothetical protein
MSDDKGLVVQQYVTKYQDKYTTTVTIVGMEASHISVTPQTLIIINKYLLKNIAK